ncbi:hypothetical protein LAWI1_G003804 [Lachnellula willkommii]|uniref:Uncharacterized protein n=1 Tax=Lachnellula willkommii TaxID=215461 RepID=A0A559MKS7_9HELO|nr:hypothetical protein LAWI1_G003804 [Lachnellula willkommii]
MQLGSNSTGWFLLIRILHRGISFSMSKGRCG